MFQKPKTESIQIMQFSVSSIGEQVAYTGWGQQVGVLLHTS